MPSPSIDYNKSVRFRFDTVNQVPLPKDAIPLDPTATLSLPTASKYVRAGKYLYNGIGYDLTEEGRYVFFMSNGTHFNVIAINYPYSGMDVYKYMSAVSGEHVHGTGDNHTGYQAISNAGRYRKWQMQCGFIAGMIHWFLPQVGFTTRVVNVSTLETPITGFDDGHIVVETKHGSDWRMWDVTNGVYFLDPVTGAHLSTAQFISQIANGGTFPTKVRLDDSDKYNAQSAGSTCLGTYNDLFTKTDAEKEIWYRRIFQQ